MLKIVTGWGRDHAAILSVINGLVDALIVLSIYWGVFLYLHIRWGIIPISLAVVSTGLYYLFATRNGLYRSWRTGPIWFEVKKVAWSWTLVILTIMSCQLILGVQFVNCLKVTISSFFIGLFTLVVWRFSLRLVLCNLRNKGRNKKYVAIVGCGESGMQIADSIYHNPWTGLEIAGIYDNYASISDKIRINEIMGIAIGNYADLIKKLETCLIDYVYIVLTVKNEQFMINIIEKLSRTKVNLYIIADLLMLDFLSTNKIYFELLSNLQFIYNHSYNSTYLIKRPQHIIKKIIDILISIVILVALLPILLTVAFALLIFEGTPVTYRSIRYISLNEKIFTYKFRSMVRNATDPKYRLKERFMNDGFLDIPLDCEVYTPIGRFLEKTQLVEILQLINILFDNMSFIGNRPLPFDNLCLLKKISGWDKRFGSPAGLTGITQVVGKMNLTPQKRLELEGMYSDVYEKGNILKCDFLIVLYTARLLLFKKNTSIEEAIIMMNSCLIK